MDWERSYFTMTDTNIDYIWQFLGVCHERGWLYQGHRPMVWCARCGTSLSQHEVTATDSYQELTHPSLYVKFRLTDVEGEALVVWTTTPWTLPANVASAVRPDGEYVRARHGDEVLIVDRARLGAVLGDDAEVLSTLRGSELVGRPYATAFDHLPAQEPVEHRVLGWDEVSLEEGTGIVHIAPGAGAEDFELGVRDGLPVLVPVDEAGAFYPGYGELTGLTTAGASDPIIAHLEGGGWLLRAEDYHHRYPGCWRCGTELIFRVVDEWFIRCDEIREPMIEAARTVEWTPPQYGKRMEDWLRNMVDWCISRKRYWGLPLPFWTCPDGHLTVISSRKDLRERALSGLEGVEELHRPWIDEVKVRCSTCDAEATRVPEVGDAWLDAGIIPFSTLGWRNEAAIPEGYADGAGVGLTRADLPSHDDWERWFPADWISEMREQIRLWFYSQLFMSVTLVGQAPYRRVLGHEKLHDETGRAMHKSWGNAIWFDDAIEQIGADVMRWMYAAQPPSQNMNFGYGPASEVNRTLLTLWNSYRFLVLNANPEGWRPSWQEADEGPRSAHPLDRWILARVQELVRDARSALDRYATPDLVRAAERFWDDLSNWYVRRSRPRFWKGEPDAFATLHHALVTLCRVVGPAMPFLSEELWGNLVARGCGADAPRSVHLAGYPEHDPERLDEGLLAAMADARDVVELGHRARAHAKLRVRQPLASVAIATVDPARGVALQSLTDEIATELNVKAVDLVEDASRLLTVEVLPNFRVLGPRLGARVQELRTQLAEGAHEPAADGRVTVGDLVLEPGEYELRTRPREGFEAVEDGTFVVAIDTRITDELALEGLARDLVRHLQNARKEIGLEVSDRIEVAFQANDRVRAAIDAHGDWIAGEVLATSMREGEASEHAFDSDGAQARFAVVRA